MKPAPAEGTFPPMLVVGWILALKGALFLFGARHVTQLMLASHPVTFDFMTRGPNGLRRYAARLRSAGFVIALAGSLMIWIGS